MANEPITINYKKEDIARLIIEELERQGYTDKNVEITFHSDMEYVTKKSELGDDIKQKKISLSHVSVVMRDI